MALIGAILGDICGSQYEFRRPHDLDWKNCELFTDKCKFTDDTVLSIATGMWLLDDDDEHKHNKEPWEFYLEYGKKYPGMGYGEVFEDWLYDDGSRGNGCAMRISPITMYFNGFANRPDVLNYYIDLAQWTCEKTHRHVESYKGVSIVTGCSFMARWGRSKEEIYQYALKNYPSSQYAYGVDRPLDDYRNNYVWSATVQDSVPVAIRCFLDSEDYESFLRNVLSLPCDTDTIAAIGGGIAEDFYKKTFDNSNEILERYLPKELLDDVSKIYNEMP